MKKDNACPICERPAEKDTMRLCGTTRVHKLCISRLPVGTFQKVKHLKK